MGRSLYEVLFILAIFNDNGGNGAHTCASPFSNLRFQFCNLKSKFFLWPAAIFCAVTAIQCARLWQPERQVLLHQRHFLDAAADHRWARLERFIAGDFKDRLGHDKPWAVRESREILRQFFALSVLDSETSVSFDLVGPETAHLQTRLRLEGTGTPVAEYVKEAVNGTREPFLFLWKKKSWKPWDWQLVSVDHPLLARAGEDL